MGPWSSVGAPLGGPQKTRVQRRCPPGPRPAILPWVLHTQRLGSQRLDWVLGVSLRLGVCRESSLGRRGSIRSRADAWFCVGFGWHGACTGRCHGRESAIRCVRSAPAAGASRRRRLDGALATRLLASLQPLLGFRLKLPVRASPARALLPLE